MTNGQVPQRPTAKRTTKYRLSIGQKLFAMVFAIALSIILLVVAVSGASLNAGFRDYVTKSELQRLDRLITQLERVWVRGNRTWDQARAPITLRDALRPRPGQIIERRLQRRFRNPMSVEVDPSLATLDQAEVPDLYAQADPPPFSEYDEEFEEYEQFGGPPPGWRPDAEQAEPDRSARQRFSPRRRNRENTRIEPPTRDDPDGLLKRIALLDANGDYINGTQQAVTSTARREITYNGALIGYVSLLPPPRLTEAADVAFLESQERTLYLVAVAAILASALAASLMARHLRLPIRQLAEASRSVAEGAYDTRLKITRRDELGELAQDFNNLASAIERQEESRKRFIADASHELRTPLAVLRAEVEAIQDGVRQVTPETLGGIHEGVMRMGRLVDELYELARADLGSMSYDMKAVEPVRLLADTLTRFEARFAEVDLSIEADFDPDAYGLMLADPDRLIQVFTNLAENTARYTDKGGKLQVRVNQHRDHLQIRFDDTSPGVPEAHMMRLFDRFHRVDEARGRDTGGSGLGLAIVKSIVDAHNGKIRAGSSPLGGLRVDIMLPLSD
ncbi:MAG: hypothetical protein Alpg2KO_03950 [Alphaproteobacteria bacterium]